MIIISLFTIVLIMGLTIKQSVASEEPKQEEPKEEEEEDFELEQIMEKLKAEDHFLRSEVVDYLSYCGHPKALDLLINTLQDKDWAVRRDTIKALGDLNDRKAVPYIAEMFNDEYWHVKKEAIRVIGVIGGKDAVEPLIILLNSEDELIKSSAQKALVKVGNMAIEGMLSKKINERWDAAKTLAALKDKRPLPLLMEALKIEKDAKVRKAIEESIEVLMTEPKTPPETQPPQEEVPADSSQTTQGEEGTQTSETPSPPEGENIPQIVEGGEEKQ